MENPNANDQDESAIDKTGWSERAFRIFPLWLDGDTYEEISKKEGISVGTVGNIVSEYDFVRMRDQRERAKFRRRAQQLLDQDELRKSGRRSVFGNPPKAIKLNFNLHPGQQDAFDTIEKNFATPTPATIVTLVCGRGWGKTAFQAYLLIKYLDANPNASVLWVAPFTSTAMSLIDDFFNGSNQDTGERWIEQEDDEGNKVWEFANTKSGPVLRWYNGATVTFRSAENPDAIVSRGYNRIIFDEAGLVQDPTVFQQKILGVARKKGIKVFLISTPRGKNWFYQIFQKGLDPSETSYLSIQQAYDRNPYFSKELKALLKDIPEFLFRQEYMAEFIDDGVGVFRGIENCTEGPEIAFPTNQQEWAPEIDKLSERRFVVGVDIAKSIDFTVLWGMDIDSGECVYYRRMNRKDYKEVLEIAAQVCRQLNNATMIYDSTGVGAGIGDFISQYDIHATPYTFTNESKTVLINKLILAIEHQKVKIPNIPTILKELRSYSFEVTKSGKLTFNAPAGGHDDVVCAFALANLYRDDQAVGNVECMVIDTVIEMNLGPRRMSYMEQWALDND